MKITFENYNNKQDVEKTKTTYSSPSKAKTEARRGYALDISGTVTDNAAYGVQGRTTEEIMQYAENIDVVTQRNYMTVMSNSMSAEDFGKMMQEGYCPSDVSIEETVTITDHIKAELAKAGVEVVGYTDTVSEKAMEEVAGSQVSAQQIAAELKTADAAVTEENIVQVQEAYEQAQELEEPTEGTKKYLVENGMDATIENLYRAQFSGNTDADKQGKGYYAEESGYYSMKAQEYDWQQLEPQMKKVIEQAGMDVNEESLEQAKWLVEKGIPLTKESLTRLCELENLELPMEEGSLLRAIATTIAGGRSAQETNLADTESIVDKAVHYSEFVTSVSDEAADLVAAQGKELNLKNLERAQQQLDRGEADFAQENVTARRKMEEIRLQMTVEANMKLLESGYKIDTTELEQLVEDLKAVEEAANKRLFQTENTEDAQAKAALYAKTGEKVSQIPYLPAATVGRLAFTEEASLDFLHETGTNLKKAYEAAGESYETVMTSPRADLGDSIRKAFRNVDDILQDMEMELTEQNRRAVRILGYNSMEITPENILAVKDADVSLKRVIDKMTPSATLEMIREDKNPLEMTVEELNEYFEHKDDEPGEQEEKYSKYLYKLEKNQEITKEERAAYIGIYRFFRQMEKGDGAAIGAVVNAGNELSFKNLLTAVRSTKKSGMDIMVNDDFGGLEQLVSGNESITAQIAKGFSGQGQSSASEQQKNAEYYKKVAGQILDTMSPEKVKEIEISPNMSLEEFAAQLEYAQTDEVLEKAYQEEQLNQFRQAQNVDDKTIQYLLDTGEEVTANNLLAADRWLNGSGEIFAKLNGYHSRLKQSAKKLQEAMNNEEEAAQAYGEFAKEAAQELEEASESQDISNIDIKEICLLHKQIHLATQTAKQEDYQIPVEINGEITSVRLRVIKGVEESGKVKITMNTQDYGDVEAEFAVNGQKLEGFIAINREEAMLDMQALGARMCEILETSDLEITGFHYAQSNRMDTAAFMRDTQEAESKVSSAQLYGIAKAFLQAVS